MVTEEPSVVAAASYASKLIKRSGGFTTTIHDRQMIGQVALFDVPDKGSASSKIQAASQRLIEIAEAHPSIVKRGVALASSGLRLGNFLIVYLVCKKPWEPIWSTP